MIPKSTSTLLNQLANATLANTLSEKTICQLQALIDLRQFYTYAQMHGLAPLIYHSLENFDLLDNLPSKTLERFSKSYYRTLAQNMQSLQALEDLRDTLPADIPFIVLKGPALIQAIYKNPALRPMTDIDLLVPAKHLVDLQETLSNLGYVTPPEHPDIYQKDKTTFDIHTDPLHADRIAERLKAVPLNVDQLWQHATPIDGQENLLTLGLPDQILTLCVHALKHGYERKIWLFDILYVVKNACEKKMWGQVETYCNKNNTTEIVAYALHAVEIHLGLDIPKTAQKLQKSFPIGRIRRKILYIAPQSGDFQILEPLIMSGQCPKRIDKLRFLISFVFPRQTALKQISGFSGHLYWLSFPYRILQLISVGSIQLARLVYRFIGNRAP